MGLADRHYMRDEHHPPHITIKLIVVLIIAFVLQSLLLHYWGIDLMKDLGLSLDGLRHGKVWQLVSFQFLHYPIWPWHLLFNCLGLYFFAKPMEEILGARKFIGLYFLSGVAGGLLQVITTAILPRQVDIPVVGASAGICGMIAIYASMFPMREITTWIYFFPITLRAIYFMLFLFCFSLFGTFVPFCGVAHAAHLGGMLVGLGYVKWRAHITQFLKNLRVPRKVRNQQREEELVRASLARGKPWRQRNTETEPEDFMSKEVDPILDKISAHGIHSLTERERKILEHARRKIRR